VRYRNQLFFLPFFNKKDGRGKKILVLLKELTPSQGRDKNAKLLKRLEYV